MILLLSPKWLLLLVLFLSNFVTFEEIKIKKTVTNYNVNHQVKRQLSSQTSTIKSNVNHQVKRQPSSQTSTINKKHLKCSKSIQIRNSRTSELQTCPTSILSQLPFAKVRDLNESETWLKDNQNLLKYVEIPGYNCFRNRDVVKGGASVSM